METSEHSPVKRLTFSAGSGTTFISAMTFITAKQGDLYYAAWASARTRFDESDVKDYINLRDTE